MDADMKKTRGCLEIKLNPESKEFKDKLNSLEEQKAHKYQGWYEWEIREDSNYHPIFKRSGRWRA
jgi:hypothetical protein